MIQANSCVSFVGWRIGLVGPIPPPAGGMAGQTQQLQQLLTQAGAQVVSVATNAPYRPAWLGRLPVLRAAARLLPYLMALWQMAGRVQVVHLMANSGWSWHLFAAPALWVASMRGVPVVVNYRGGEAEIFLRRSARLVRFSMRRATCLVVPSGFLQEIFARHQMPAEIVPNIVDLLRFQPVDHVLSLCEAHIIVTRNLEPLYDIASALRAFALLRQQIPGARMTIAGTGPDEARLRQLAQTLSIADAVVFCGRLDRDAVAQLYRRASVMLNPSLADNMPNSLLEALASGVPVVSTRVGGVPYMVEHEVSALLTPPGVPEAMAQALIRILQDTTLRERLIRHGLEKVQDYTWQKIAPLLYQAYARACAGAAA